MTAEERKEYDRQRWRRWYQRNRTKHIEAVSEWKLRNPEKFKQQYDRNNESKRKRLSNAYIANNIKLPIAVIPRVMIEAKRAQIMIWRKLWDDRRTSPN